MVNSKLNAGSPHNAEGNVNLTLIQSLGPLGARDNMLGKVSQLPIWIYRGQSLQIFLQSDLMICLMCIINMCNFGER